MFEEIHAIRKRSNAFVKNIEKHKLEAIEINKKKFIKINQAQLQDSKLATGKAITPLYSPAYALVKGYKKPDLYKTGNMYNKMDAKVYKKTGTLGIFSTAPYTKYLKRYGKIFGISPKNLPKATISAVKSFGAIWFKLVIRK